MAHSDSESSSAPMVVAILSNLFDVRNHLELRLPAARPRFQSLNYERF